MTTLGVIKGVNQRRDKLRVKGEMLYDNSVDYMTLDVGKVTAKDE